MKPITKCITVINQKGGVGKTTTAAAIAAGLQKQGQKVLAIDLDGQGNLSLTWGIEKSQTKAGASDIIKGTGKDAAALTVSTPQGEIIPATGELAIMERELANQNATTRLREWLKENAAGYDYVVVDTPPALGVLAINALMAADTVVIPAQADIYSLQGIGQLHQTIAAVRKHGNPALKIAGILCTRHNGRTNLTKNITAMLENAAKKLGTKVFDTKIRECTAIKEAAAVGMNIFAYAPKSNGAIDYQAFLDELEGSMN